MIGLHDSLATNRRERSKRLGMKQAIRVDWVDQVGDNLDIQLVLIICWVWLFEQLSLYKYWLFSRLCWR